MARLIPSVFDDTAPPGERRVFDYLSKGPSNWTALHSLDLAPWDGNRRTEIDFLVIIPDTGIVCVEVKSHQNIEFDGAQWRPSGIRDPFKQALDAAKGFHRRLRKERKFDRIPVVHLCVFPESPFRPEKNWSKGEDEFIDALAFSACREASQFCELIKAKARKQISGDPQISPIGSVLLSPQIESLVKLCLPIQTRRVPRRDEIDANERALAELLHDQQKPVLNILRNNQRLLVEGPAGTGKTLIAMEVAIQKSIEGNRVGLVCFNQLVARWMRQSIEARGHNSASLIVDTAHALLKNLLQIQVPEKPSSEYWTRDFIGDAISRLTDPFEDFSSSFDFLVIDEAQDLLSRPEVLECLLMCLKGGREQGSFLILGDLKYQVLRHGPISEEMILGRVGPEVVRFSLDENCRNLRKVGRAAVRLSGLGDGVYSSYLRGAGRSENFDYYSYSSDSEQVDWIKKKLLELKEKGYRESETTVLSFRTHSKSIAGKLDEARVLSNSLAGPGDPPRITSVDAFKGMENVNIILADVELNESEEIRNLFYTGMTRSKENLYVLVDASTDHFLEEWL